MPLQSCGDVAVAGVLAAPSSLLGICLKGVNVGEFVGEGRDELDRGGQVVAGLADVGVGAGFAGRCREQ